MTSLNSKLQLALLNRKKGRNLLEKGFTLVELMIVIVIVGVLSAVALPNFLSQTAKAKATECTSKGGAIIGQVGSESLLDTDAAFTLLTDLITTENGIAGDDAGAGAVDGTSDLCEFATTLTAAPASGKIYTMTATGKADSDIDGKYFAAFCINGDTGKKDFSTSTSVAQIADATSNDKNVDCS